MSRHPGPRYVMRLKNTEVYVLAYSNEGVTVCTNMYKGIKGTLYTINLHIDRLSAVGYELEAIRLEADKPINYRRPTTTPLLVMHE